jgi:hypothetical protein
MKEGGKENQWVSFVGVVLLALILPGMLRLMNTVTRNLVGAEGRLAAINIDTDRTLGPLQKNWSALSQGGNNLRSFMDYSAESLAEIKPEYVRIDNVYDEFSVVKRDVNSNIYYDWSDLDTLVKKILAVGAKPFFSLSYMPKELAVNGDALAEPQNWSEWTTLVQKTVEHYSGDMAIDNVYYEIWNEPDLFGKWTLGGKKDYQDLYTFGVRGAQQANGVKPFKIGGAAVSELDRSWTDKFFPFILQNKLRLDFFSWHRYGQDLTAYAEDINNVEKWFNKLSYFAQTEEIISESGPSREAGGVNDTETGAAHLVAVARELLPKVKYGFNSEIWGDKGITGKPRQKALVMLAGLGENRLPITGEGTWVKAIATNKGQGYQVVLVNYDEKSAHNESVPVTFLSLKDRIYTLTSETLDGKKTTDTIATSEAKLQITIPMPANSVVRIELQPVTQTN